jgi:hypothetical protein
MALKSKQTKIEEEELPFPVEVVNEEEPITEVAVVDQPQNTQLADYELLNPDLPMSVKVGVATNVANCLSDLIKSQGLVKKGLNKKDPEAEYVLVEGWEVLGTMLGIVPVTEIVEPICNDKGKVRGYKARAYLYRNPVMEHGEIVSGTLIATTEASATVEGFQKDTAGMMSMAQTRALGKCYRMALSWIMKMAGYEGTPAEDMPKYRGGK